MSLVNEPAAWAFMLGMVAGTLLWLLAELRSHQEEAAFRERLRAADPPPCAMCGYQHRILLTAECIRFAHGMANDRDYPPQYAVATGEDG